MEEKPKTKFDFLVEEMKQQGFNYYGMESLLETRGVGVKNNPEETFKFINKQVQTEESIIEDYKNKPEFSNIKDKIEVKLIKQENSNEIYYVFAKILD